MGLRRLRRAREVRRLTRRAMNARWLDPTRPSRFAVIEFKDELAHYACRAYRENELIQDATRRLMNQIRAEALRLQRIDEEGEDAET